MTTSGRSPSSRCPSCEAPPSRVRPEDGTVEITGVATIGPVRATVEGSAPPRCADCGTARGDHVLLTADVRASIAERLVSGVGRVGASQCGACAAGLDLPMRATARALTVLHADDAPFTVTVELPLVRCGGCAVENVPPELVMHVERAVLTACGVPSGPEQRTGPLRRLRRRVGRGSLGHPSRP